MYAGTGRVGNGDYTLAGGGNRMKIYTFGDRQNPVILLLPGTCCHWKNSFEKVIPLLEQDFYVACVSYDGFDETEDTVFPGMLEETEKIENYIRENFDGKVECAYGCSLGGSFVGLLIQRKNIHINHGILGSSDLDQMAKLPAYIFVKSAPRYFIKCFKKGKCRDLCRSVCRCESNKPKQTLMSGKCWICSVLTDVI
jgi:hypothetical protein